MRLGWGWAFSVPKRNKKVGGVKEGEEGEEQDRITAKDPRPPPSMVFSVSIVSGC